MSKVLVTGGSGFLGGHCILQLLAAGHEVRTTVRDLAREADLRATLEQAGAETRGRLVVITADLERDAGWADAAEGCEFVLHVASPFPAGVPAHEDELIVPAREGTLRVLRAARGAGVRRVVVTSSFAAVGYGHPDQGTPFDERDWTDVNGADVLPYIKSKTLAERAAWDFIATEGGRLELAVVNPVGIFGPVLSADLASSVMLVKRMLEGGIPGCPDIHFGVVDVRDVVELHLRVMTHPAAKGERFLAVAGPALSMRQVATILKTRLGPAASRVSTRHIPDWLVRLAALRNPTARQAAPQLGKVRDSTSEKARVLLDWRPRSAEEAIAATGESLIRLGAVKG